MGGRGGGREGSASAGSLGGGREGSASAGSFILALGYVGANGAGIFMGEIALYCAAGRRGGREGRRDGGKEGRSFYLNRFLFLFCLKNNSSPIKHNSNRI